VGEAQRVATQRNEAASARQCVGQLHVGIQQTTTQQQDPQGQEFGIEAEVTMIVSSTVGLGAGMPASGIIACGPSGKRLVIPVQFSGS
jgi:hypothetical protein